LYFGKGNFGGKNLLFKRVNLLCKEGFSIKAKLIRNLAKKFFDQKTLNLKGRPICSSEIFLV
jgi:hypothetical protein